MFSVPGALLTGAGCRSLGAS
uniref:Uncharacterized protein n=1 Tax=Arundo donax TaxID=35708 RepID=A0A0A9F0T7_ARUDO